MKYGKGSVGNTSRNVRSVNNESNYSARTTVFKFAMSSPTESDINPNVKNKLSVSICELINQNEVGSR